MPSLSARERALCADGRRRRGPGAVRCLAVQHMQHVQHVVTCKRPAAQRQAIEPSIRPAGADLDPADRTPAQTHYRLPEFWPLVGGALIAAIGSSSHPPAVTTQRRSKQPDMAPHTVLPLLLRSALRPGAG